MNDPSKLRKLLIWLLYGSKGGPTRAKIILALRRRPMNPNQLAKELKLNYKTVIHHLEILRKHGLVSRLEESYGAPYFISDALEKNWEIVESILR